MLKQELPTFMQWFPVSLAGRIAGWNLILKAYKPK
jgi:hypothetical protein